MKIDEAGFGPTKYVDRNRKQIFCWICWKYHILLSRYIVFIWWPFYLRSCKEAWSTAGRIQVHTNRREIRRCKSNIPLNTLSNKNTRTTPVRSPPKPKFHLARHVTSRHDTTFDVSSLSNSMVRHVRLDALDTSNVSCCFETWRDEPSGISALTSEMAASLLKRANSVIWRVTWLHVKYSTWCCLQCWTTDRVAVNE